MCVPCLGKGSVGLLILDPRTLPPYLVSNADLEWDLATTNPCKRVTHLTPQEAFEICGVPQLKKSAMTP